MEKLPKHTNVKVVTIYGETLEGIIIPLSIKANMDIEASIEELKNNLTKQRDVRYETLKTTLMRENPTEENMKEAYIEAKITYDLAKVNEKITDERVKSLKDKRSIKLLEGKTYEDLLKELIEIGLDLDVRKAVLNKSVNKTLWHILRKKDDLKQHLFITIDDLEDSLDMDTILNIFNSSSDSASEEELKN
jgi:hypothetical protein